MRLLLAGLLLAASCATVQAAPCPLPGQAPMLMARLYFGQSGPDGRPIPDSDWRRFLDQAIAARFPDGFTVYDAQGGWRDRQGRAVREQTRVVEIALPDSAPARARIAQTAQLYRRRFHQQSVGIVTETVCAVF